MYFHIMSCIFGVNNEHGISSNALPKKWRNSMMNFFSYVCDGKFKSESIGIFEQLLFLIQEETTVKIPKKALEQLYPREMRIITAVQ